jgi:exopolysaccharide biosynthesis polyprenyl glycosylphosphotransferase
MGTLHFSERRLLLLVGDVGAGIAALLTATWFREVWDDPGNAWVSVWVVVLGSIHVIAARATDAQDLGRARNPFSGSYDAVRAWLLAFLIYLAVPYWSAPLLFSRNLVAQVATLGLGLTVAWRLIYAALAGRTGTVTRYVALGGGPGVAAIARAIDDNLGQDHVLLGYVDTVPDAFKAPADVDAPTAIRGADHVQCLGGVDTLPRVVGSGEVSTLIVVAGGSLAPDLQRHVIAAYEAGIRVVPMPDLFEAVTGRVPIEHAAGFWSTTLLGSGRDWDYRLASRARDIAIAIVGLAITAILVPFEAVAMHLHGPGPIFYRQVRLGRNGRPFTIWKFRSMVPDAEANGGAQWARPGDVRVPAVGRFLRATRLDEFPQFWNVLRGEMSVVGPRPERPELVDRLEAAVPFYRVRLAVLPGLTGWAQVRAPYAASEAETLIKFEYDLYYLRHQSLYLDLLIMVKTLGVIARFRGR